MENIWQYMVTILFVNDFEHLENMKIYCRFSLILSDNYAMIYVENKETKGKMKMDFIQKNIECVTNMKKSADLFTGDKALFWAGKMANTIAVLESSSIFNASPAIHLLHLLRLEYDREIIARTCH